jgi:hypothetical protein
MVFQRLCRANTCGQRGLASAVPSAARSSPSGTLTARPQLARTPSGIAEIVADRGQRIGPAAPDVGQPVAIGILRHAQIDAGQELRIAEGPGPASDQLERGTPRSIILSSAMNSR